MSEWIPVSERLPEHMVQVLGALKSTSGKYNISRINYNKHATDYDWEADGFEVSCPYSLTSLLVSARI